MIDETLSEYTNDENHERVTFLNHIPFSVKVETEKKILPTKLEITNWIYYLDVQIRKVKGKDNKARLRKVKSDYLFLMNNL